MRKYVFIIVAATCLLAIPIAAVGANWHTELVDSGGGYWQTRVAVELENPSDKPVAGQGVRLVIGADAGQLPLAGSTTQSLRVVNADGLEYLYRIEAAGGAKDVLSAGDAFIFAVDVPAKSKATYFILCGQYHGQCRHRVPGRDGLDLGSGGKQICAHEFKENAYGRRDKGTGASPGTAEDRGAARQRCVESIIGGRLARQGGNSRRVLNPS